MKALLVCTHGKSAKELVASAEMICGKQQNCASIPFTMGESPDKLMADLESKIQGLDLSDGLLCLTDLKGGTPFNILVKMTQTNPSLEIVTGVNIPMLLEFFIRREQSEMPDLIKQVIEAGHSGIYQYAFLPESGKDEDF